VAQQQARQRQAQREPMMSPHAMVLGQWQQQEWLRHQQQQVQSLGVKKKNRRTFISLIFGT
jgi:hypothetical protein